MSRIEDPCISECFKPTSEWKFIDISECLERCKKEGSSRKTSSWFSCSRFASSPHKGILVIEEKVQRELNKEEVNATYIIVKFVLYVLLD